MVGRHCPSGDPLIPPQSEPIPGVCADDSRNRFTYDADSEGIRYPLGAHVRRVNPRTADMPGGRQEVRSGASFARSD